MQATNHFDNVFSSQANNDLTIETGDAVMLADVTGIFSVLVKRGEGTPVTMINTIGTASSISHIAVKNHTNNNYIRDTRILEYKVPKTTNVYFAITLK